jgi:hypothetical protein
VAVDFEAEDLGFVAAPRFDGDEGGVDLEEHVVKGGAEVGAVDGGVFAGFGGVDVFTARMVLELIGLRLEHGEK